MTAKQRIAIVGAGLGGLAAAIALRQQDFEADVYEQAPELGAFGAGINLSANAVKVFEAYGLKGRLHEVSFEPEGHAWRNWTSGIASRVLPLGQSVSRYGSNYYIMHRGDLHRLLCEAVPASCIHLSKRCVAVESRARSALVSFADGTSVEADVVIGADGIHSAVRRVLFGGVGARLRSLGIQSALQSQVRLQRVHNGGIVRATEEVTVDGGAVGELETRGMIGVQQI